MPALGARISVQLLLLPLTVTALSTPPSFNEISSTSKGVKSLVSSLTAVVNSLGGAEQASEPRQREFESLTTDVMLEGLRRDFVENEYLWSGKIDPELYDEDAIFTDPTLSFSGLATFEKNLENLDPWIERFVPPSQRSVELKSLRLLEEEEGGGEPVIEAEWRMLGDLALPWKPRLDLDGRTRYTLGGAGGRISSYDEAWAISPAAALAMLVTPYKAGADEAVAAGVAHWPGQLEGAAAPTPAVVLTDAPPFVVLPGFGNDAIDYVAPLEQSEEVGLTAALRRRGVGAVSVVPIARANWLNVLRGLGDVGFLTGDAQPDGPAFMWYLRKAQEAVEQAVAARRSEQGEQGEGSGPDARVVLLGHSAGGWLARALCELDAEWTRRHVRGIVSLGAPHLGPPPGVPDQVRGTVTNLNARAPGAHLRTDGLLYVTVASDRVRGDEAAAPGSAAKIAYNSYRMICGNGDVAGDGVVPLVSAHLDGADAQLTLDCYHSINEAGTTRPTDDWYGAERRIDEWLGTVAEALDAQQPK